MDEARERLLTGQAAPFWIVAERQSGGRGRHGRQWASPPGNLYATLAVATPCAPANAPQLGFVAGVALHRAVAAVTGLTHPRLAIKWPNDLLLDGAKFAGLLLEGSTVGGRFHVLIGFGVNIARAPEGTPYRATALSAHESISGADTGTSRPLTSERILAELGQQWTLAEAVWRQGFGGVRDAWLKRAALLGESIAVRLPDGERRGLMRGIDESGRLVLDMPEGVVRIDAGDVFPVLSGSA